MQHNVKFDKKMIKLAIFDLDGTLLDTLGDIAGACNHALTVCGCPVHEVGEYKRFVGSGIMNLFRRALPEEQRTEEMVIRMRNAFVQYYDIHKDDTTSPYPGIRDLLKNLSAKGIALAVASNKYQEATEELVARYFGDYSFTCILGQREGHPIKPDAGIIFEAMASCEGVSQDEVIYCGDSDVDMQTGINAGVKTVGVTWGFRSREELAAYSPCLLADNPEEIHNFIALT
jgi:phosphoglycolate phosphatase